MPNGNKEWQESTSRKGNQRKWITAILASALLVNSGVVYASDTSESKGSQVTIAANAKITYNDYKADQYWSQDMLWAIEKGLLTGYINKKHPTNKKIKTVANWLNPSGDLTEAQLLRILFRYSKPDELKKIVSSNPKMEIVNLYKLAEKYYIPTKGSSKYTYPASEVVTRGTVARAIASMHIGKETNIDEAVKFMYNAGISTGYADSTGKKPLTLKSFGDNKPLTRAHIVSFVKGYDEFMANGSKLKPVLKENATNYWIIEEIVLNQSKIPEKELLKKLETAFSDLKKSPDVESYSKVVRAFMSIDRKIDYIGWTNISELSFILDKYMPLIDPSKAKVDTNYSVFQRKSIESSAGIIKKLKAKVEKLKSSKPQNPILEEINVKYGAHGYSSMNQKEYDEVLAFVQEAIKGYDDIQIGGEYETYYEEYLDGARPLYDRRDPSFRTKRNTGLLFAGQDFSPLLEEGVSKEDTVKAIKTAELVSNVLRDLPKHNVESRQYIYDFKGSGGNMDFKVIKESPETEVSISAYDQLVRGIDGRQSEVMMSSAIFDALGYNTMVGSANGYIGHALFVEINNKWWGVYGNTYTKVDLHSYKEFNVIAEPTLGPTN